MAALDASARGAGRGVSLAAGSTGAIAVVTRDRSLAAPLSDRAQRRGWRPVVVPALDGPEDLIAQRVAGAIIDREALEGDWWALLGELCAACPGTALLVCDASSTVAERVRGLRLGLDDWLTKPCHPEELLARVETAVRRRRGSTPASPLAAGELEIRTDRYDAFASGHPAGLTRREFELLLALARADGAVVERERIYEEVWGYAMAHGDRSVDVFVRKLRLKLEAASPHWRYVHTHFGVGYRFAAAEQPDDDARGA